MGESTNMADIYSWCEQAPDFTADYFGEDGLVAQFTEQATGDARLAVQYVGESTFNVEFPQDPVIVRAQVAHGEFELIIADTLLQKSVLEIVPPTNDVYGPGTMNLGDGAVVDIATTGVAVVWNWALLVAGLAALQLSQFKTLTECSLLLIAALTVNLVATMLVLAAGHR